MLHKEAVSPDLLELVKKLLSYPELGSFRLVGGTALALQIGHRKSVDIDLFSDKRLRSEEWILFISEKFPYAENTAVVGFGITTTINNIKIDLCCDGGKFFGNTIVDDGIVMASLKDIAAMKLGAIISRFTKKDFYDLAILSDIFSLEEMIGFYRAHYPFMDYRVPLESINKSYKADDSIEPVLLNTMTWDRVKKRLLIWQQQYIDEKKLLRQKQIDERLKNAESLLSKKKK